MLLDANPLHGCPGGVYIGLPLRVTMVNPAGRGSQPSVSMLAVFSADFWGPPTVGPADWSGTEPTGCVRRGRVLPAADYCSRASNDVGLVIGLWKQCRRLRAITVAIPRSHLVNGTWGPWEGPAGFGGPTPNGSDSRRSRRLKYSR